MTRLVEFTALILASLGLVLLAARLWRFRTGARRTLCPGPRPGWALRLSPLGLFSVRGCWYDLTALPADAEGRVTCPECGSSQKPSGRARRPHRWRTGRMAAALLMTALACWNVRYLRSGRWAWMMPTPVLLAMDTLAPSLTTPPLLDQLYERAEHGRSMWRWWTVRRAVHALGDDGLKCNAEWGIAVLGAAMPSSLPVIEAALADGDLQRRQFAGWLLMTWMDGDERPRRLPEGYEPPARLCEVAVEALRDDDSPYAGGMSVDNAYVAYEFLRRRATEATGPLGRALSSDDPQQRLYAAAVTASARHPTLAGEAAEVLRTHLAANKHEGDALLAYRALFEMGPDALPHLEAAYDAHAAGGPRPDPQAADTAELLIRRLRGEPLTQAQIRRLNAITSTSFDPSEAPAYGLQVWFNSGR